MPFYDLTCKNGHNQIDVLLKLGERPPCPTCGEPTETLWIPSNRGAHGDEIPGGIEVRHGLVHEDGSPMKFYSWTDYHREAKRRGLYNHVEHVPIPGTDKSPHTTRWV